MNFAQPLGTQHASKIYTSSAFKSITVLHSANYIVNYGKLSCEYAASAWGTGNNAPHTVYMGTRSDNVNRPDFIGE